jgi:phosphatidylserine decarboxylase
MPKRIVRMTAINNSLNTLTIQSKATGEVSLTAMGALAVSSIQIYAFCMVFSA